MSGCNWGKEEKCNLSLFEWKYAEECNLIAIVLILTFILDIIDVFINHTYFYGKPWKYKIKINLKIVNKYSSKIINVLNPKKGGCSELRISPDVIYFNLL